MHPLTNSEMSAFQACRRGWWMTYYRRLRRIHDWASLPSIGSMYHSALELYYREGRTDVAQYVRDWTDKLVAEYPELEKEIRKDGEKTAIMVEGYFQWLEEEGADIGYQVVGAEETVEVLLDSSPYRLRGKIDARLEREADGAWLQLEHKTVSNLTDIPRYAQSAPQFLTYDLLAFLKAKQEGSRPTDGVIVNMAKRVLRTAKANPPFYARYEVRHNVDELRSHFRHVVANGKQIEEVRARLDAGENHHDVCPPSSGRNHLFMCRCAPVTTMFDDGSDIEGYLADFYEEYDPWERYEGVHA